MEDLITSMLHTAALHTDPHLEVDMLFRLPPKPHQAKIHPQTLEMPTIHHLDTVMVASSQHHSWQEVLTSNQTKWKSSMKLATNRKVYICSRSVTSF